MTTPPPPQTPEPEANEVAHSSDSGTSFTVLDSWNEEQPQRPVNIVAPIQRQEDGGDKDRQEDAAPAVL